MVKSENQRPFSSDEALTTQIPTAILAVEFLQEQSLLLLLSWLGKCPAVSYLDNIEVKNYIKAPTHVQNFFLPIEAYFLSAPPTGFLF